MIGRNLKQYLVEEKLGQGGMGVVYRARDTSLNRPVALKVLSPDLVRDEERRRRFVQEARAASAVNHPSIAQIYEIVEEGDPTFIVMEYVDGATLRELVARRELDITSAIEVGIQVGEALGRAHESGIIHRDIKSDNIMVTRDGHPKILDFGLAKLLDSGAGGETAGTSHVETLARTREGMILGTLAYMSPEQARGQVADRRSDIFSFGVVLYEAATAHLPFSGASALETMHAIAYETPKPLSSVRGDLPYSLQRVIDRCLRKKPEERYQEMGEVVTDLRTVKKEIETGTSGSVPVLDKVRWWLAEQAARGTLWTAGVGAGIGGLVVLLLMGGNLGNPWSWLFCAAIAALIYRRIRNRGVREVRRFVEKASKIREIQVIAFHRGQFTVAVEEATAKTYLKLNALLTSANERLYHGEPMTMVVRDDMDGEEMKKVLGGMGVHYMREGAQERTLGRAGKRA
jgi:predicted Ser/Thr protein kinase